MLILSQQNGHRNCILCITSRIPGIQLDVYIPWRCASVVYDMPIKATRQHHTTVDNQFHMVIS